MKKKNSNLRYYSFKKLGQEIDLINKKILEKIQKYYAFQQALDSIIESIKKLNSKKVEVHSILRERKQLAKNMKTISKIQKLMKK